MANEELNTKVTANAEGFVSAMKDAGNALEGFVRSLGSGSLTEMGEQFLKLGAAAAPLLGLAAAGLAVHEAFKLVSESVAEAAKWNVEADQLSRQLGITAQEASVLNETLKDNGISTEAYTRAANFMTRALNNGSDGFRNLGVQTRNADGSFRNTNELMLDVLDTLAKMPASTERNIIGQQLFGRSWLTSQDIIRLTKKALEETSEQMDKLGTKATPETIAASRQFNLALNEVKSVLEAFAINIGNALMPALTVLLRWFRDEGTAAVQIFREVLTALGDAFGFIGRVLGPVIDIFASLARDIIDTFVPALSETFGWIGDKLPSAASVFKAVFQSVAAIIVTVVAVVRIAWEAVADFISRLSNSIGVVAEAALQAIQGNYSEARRVWQRGSAAIEDDQKASAERIKRIWEDANAKVAEIAAAGAAVDQGPKGMETPGTAKTPTIAPKNQFATWKQELEEIKLQQENWYTWNNERELAFWQEKLGLAQKGTNAYKSVLSEVQKFSVAERKDEIARSNADAAAGLAASKAKYDEDVAALVASYKKKEDAAKSAEEAERMRKQSASKIAIETEVDPYKARAMAFEAAAQEKAAQDQLAIELAAARAKEVEEHKRLIERKMELDRIYLLTEIANTQVGTQQRIDAVKKLNDAEAAAKKELNKVEAAEDLARQKDQEAAAKRTLALRLEADKKAADDFKQHTKEIEGFLQPFVSGFQNGIKKLIDGTLSFGDAIKGMGKMLVTAMGDAIAQMITDWIAMLAKKAALWLANLLFQQTSEESANAVRLAVGAPARIAEAEGMAAVGSVAAAASAAAVPGIGWIIWPGVMETAYAAMSGQAMLAAAAGGYDIPSGINPIVQAHAQEMILPAPISNFIRDSMRSTPGETEAPAPEPNVTHVHNWNISTMDATSFTQHLRNNSSSLAKVLQELTRDRKLKPA